MRRSADGEQLRRYSRAEFLTQTAASVLTLATSSSLAAQSTPEPNIPEARADSKVHRWALITIGNLSRNRYWGESDVKGVRSAICTCTLIEGPGFRLLVDPSLQSADDMARELDRRSGLKPSDISAVFVTHEHGDHYAGLAHFSQARWFAGSEVAALLNATRKWSKLVESAPKRLFEALDVVATPGHTMGLHSLRFDSRGHSVAVVGDAVATEDFWRERRGYFNCVDFAASAKSMDKIAGLADLIVPGHDNFFQAK